MNTKTFETFGASMNNVFLRMQEMQNEMVHMREKMRNDFAKAMESIDTNLEKLEKYKSTDQQDQTTTSTSMSTITNNNGNVQAYRVVTTNDHTAYQKGIPLPSGNIMWMTCPEGEIDTAKEYLAKQAENPTTPVITNNKVPTLHSGIFKEGFEERLNSLFGGHLFGRDMEENNPEDEPTEEELNELEDIKEEEERAQKEKETVINAHQGDTHTSNNVRHTRYKYDPSVGRFVFEE